MERGNASGFHRYRKHAKQVASGSSSGKVSKTGKNAQQTKNAPTRNDAIANNVPNIVPPNKGNNNSKTGVQGATQQNQASQSLVREQDQYMPIANVIRIMRRILPAHAKISDDAKETIQECVSEYISFITGEANDRCQREQRKTVTAEDVIWAMGKLGFDNYVEPLTVFLNRYREYEIERTSIRDPILKRSAADYGPIGMPAYMPPFPMGDPQGFYDAAAMLEGYYRDPSGAAGAGSSQNPLINFDPFAHFK